MSVAGECLNKKRYDDKKAAMSELNLRVAGRSRRRRGKPVSLRAYACPHCRGWHLTKMV